MEDIKVLRRELEEVLKKFGEKHQMTVEVGSISYDNIGFKTQLRATVKQVSEDLTGAQAEFIRGARKYGIDPSVYLKKIKFENKIYTITGINTRARTKPLLLEKDGKTYSVGINFLKYVIEE